MNDNFRQDIFNLLTKIPTRKLDGLCELWAELGYDQANNLISTRAWPTNETECMAEPPRIIATTATNGDFRIIYCRLKDPHLRLVPQRSIINRLIQDNPFGLFIFSNADQTAYHLVNVKYEQLRPDGFRPNRFLKPVRSESVRSEPEYGNIFRRISIGQTERLRTATARLSLLDVETMPLDLSPLTVQQRHDEAFDVEAVTKEFYREVAMLFTDLVGGERKEGKKTRPGQSLLRLPSTVDDQTRKEFAVRLMGRLLFCWFLRKKQSDQSEPLIPAEVLSLETMQNNRSAATSKDVALLYHELLEPLFFETLNQQVANRKPEFKQGHWAKIPFLNGGLFEAHADDFYHPTHVNTLVVPDKWLIQLIDLFERFNFTIQESTPLDMEVAVDPEMLGKIFENLLAEINPETGETARKATGSYYTPRPIVDYMVDESLKQYLKNLTGFENLLGWEANLSALFSYGNDTNPFDEATTARLIQALDELKILDPACGSGAFPMGILQKVLLLLQKLDPQNKKWKARQLDKTRHLSDPRARELAREMIERAFANKQLDYGRKLYLIQNCIYGVDIQPIAVEIAKLRCFLSLVIDMPIDEGQANRGIMALPNLEFKFICANTLIGLSQSKEFADSLAATEIRELKTLATDYLTSYGTAKARLKTEFEAVQQRMGKKLGQWRGQTEALQLLNWHPFEHTACAWFDPALMLGVKDGFDVVIGNPPWVSLIGKHGIEDNRNVKDIILSIYNGNTYMPNLYEFFIQKGLQLARNGACLVYIIPDRFAFNSSFAYLRKKLLKEFVIKEIVYKWDFESIIADTMTFICQKQIQSDYLLRIKNRPHEPYITVSKSELLKSEDYVFKSFTDLETRDLILKIKTSSVFLSNFCRTTSGFGGKSQLITSERIDSTQIPILKGSSIQRYAQVKRFYFEFKPQNITGRTKDTKKLGVTEKILLRKTGNRIIATFDNTGVFPEQSLYFIFDLSTVIDFKFLLGLLNSKLMTWYYLNYLVTNLDSTPQLKNYDLDSFPIRVNNQQQPIIALVDQILSAKRANPQADTSAMEAAIDKLVYELYGLTAAEIALVEGRPVS